MYTFRTEPEDLESVAQPNGSLVMAFPQSMIPPGFNAYGSYGYGRHGYRSFDFCHCDGPGPVCNSNLIQTYTHF